MGAAFNHDIVSKIRVIGISVALQVLSDIEPIEFIKLFHLLIDMDNDLTFKTINVNFLPTVRHIKCK